MTPNDLAIYLGIALMLIVGVTSYICGYMDAKENQQ